MSVFFTISTPYCAPAIAEAVSCASIISWSITGDAWHVVTGTIRGEPLMA
jgi:hypothetical protein